MKTSKSLIILEQVHSDIERHERFDSLDESIIGGRLSDYLILEAEKQSPEEVKKKIKDAANQARQELDKLRDVSKKLGNLKSVNDAIEQLTDELSESTQDIDAADISKGGLKNKIFRSGLEKLTVASAAISSLEKSIKTGVENLFNAIKVRIDPKDEQYADKSVRDIVGGNTARLNKVVASIQKSIGGEDKGFFGNLGRSIKSFFSKARGTVLPKIDAKQYAEDLLDVKLGVLNQYTDSPVAADADNVNKDASGTLDKLISDTSELAAPLEKTSNDGSESDSGGESQKDSSAESGKEGSVKVDRAQNVGTFPRKVWVKAISDSANDPDKQQQFADKVNKIANKKILENKKNIISESRWAQLAGIKDDE